MDTSGWTGKQKKCATHMQDINELPFVSVIMGVCYSRQDTYLLQRSIESILCQTYRNFEFLICENGSTVEAKHLLKKFQEQDNRIHLVNGAGADRLSQKLNRCIAIAKGQFFARMDDDDFAHENRLKKQIRFLMEHPIFAFVGSNVNEVYRRQVCGERIFPSEPEVRDFFVTQPFIHPTLVFRSEMLLDVGGYSEKKYADRCEDYDLLLRMYQKGHTGANIQDILLDYSISAEKPPLWVRKNEIITRYLRFRDLGLLPREFGYVLKPLAAAFTPNGIKRKWKQ